VKLAASVLAADLGHLAEQVRAAERGGAAFVHVDVMDGRFVPNISLGPIVVRALKRITALPIGAHLMIESAERYLEDFVEAGASWVTVHVEAVTHLERAIARLHELGVAAGVALNPATPLVTMEEILPELEHVLVMSVNPGFGGQSLLPASLDKMRRLRAIILTRGLRAEIQIDGGVHAGNIRAVVEAGAQTVIAGSAVFGEGDPEAAARALIEAATSGARELPA
jgi:ribulose-phosphate 3-epimerase